MKPTLPLLACCLLVTTPVLAHADDDKPQIVVTGQGEMALAPDMAVLTLGVLRDSPTAGQALDADNKAMSAIIAALKAEGIASRDLQTSDLALNPRYGKSDADAPDAAQRIVAYQATNSLTVRVRDIGKVGEIVDRAVKLGVNEGTGIAFTNADPNTALTTARRRAVADARAKAETLAQAANVGLGRVMNISEQSYGSPPMPMNAKIMRFAAPAVPIEGGENTYRVSVSVTYALRKQPK